MVGKINGNEVSFLFDSEATHNFVDQMTANRLGLKIVNVDNYSITVVDGEKLQGAQGCK